MAKMYWATTDAAAAPTTPHPKPGREGGRQTSNPTAEMIMVITILLLLQTPPPPQKKKRLVHRPTFRWLSPTVDEDDVQREIAKLSYDRYFERRLGVFVTAKRSDADVVDEKCRGGE